MQLMACVSNLLQYCPGEWKGSLVAADASPLMLGGFDCSVWKAALLRAGWDFVKTESDRETSALRGLFLRDSCSSGRSNSDVEKTYCRIINWLGQAAQ